MKIERPRGTHDILPTEQPLWRRVTGEIELLAALYGYRPIQTPVFEDTELFARTSGVGSDVVQKEMYTLHGPLRPLVDAAAGGDGADLPRVRRARAAPRAAAAEALHDRADVPLRRRPAGAATASTGRPPSRRSAPTIPPIDAELIQLYDTLLGRLGVTDVPPRAQLDRLPRVPARLPRRAARVARSEPRPSSTRTRARRPRRARCASSTTTPPSREPVSRRSTRAPKIGESLCEACVEHFAQVRATLDATGVAYKLVPTLVRGLDYYSRTTWEFIGPMENENSTISGGGRYDYLVEEIGGPPTPGVGFGAGIERLLIAMEEAGATAEPAGMSVFLAVEPDAPRELALGWLKALRDRGRRRRHRLRGPLAQGPADPGRPLGGGDHRRRRSRDGDDPAARRGGRAGPARGRSRQTTPMTWRTHMCGEPTKELVGEKITLAGWTDRRRDHGGLVFVDLRDRTGITQVVINPEHAPDAARLAHEIRNEFVLRAEGTLVARSPETVNPNMPTGEVELQVERLDIVSRSTPLPFQLDEENVDETLRLRYRWLDLRRERLQRNITLRAQMVGIIRREMEAAGFLDIQTPILFKPTPEGARDFVVPSRLQKGRFYALPQSPQILKQLTMVAGFDRYYQIAICFRDEDLRADRVQEITQLDVEMTFPDQEVIYGLMERMYARIWRECLEIEIETPFPRMTFAESDRRFGSDKPDTRFELELEDATEVTRASEFGVFKSADAVRFLRVPQELSRADLARLEEVAKEWGAKGLAYLVYDEEGEVRSPIAKFLSEEELARFRGEPATTVLFAADTWETTSRVLGALRLHLGRELGLIDDERFTFLWVYDFPMFERDEEEGRWTAVHHPFTRPTPAWEQGFYEDPAGALAQTYDLVVNGNELGGGSFRIHEPTIQAQVFELLGMSEDEQRSKFGFLLDALAMGAPPMGGIALGIDRMTMVLAGEPNLRDVIAFPKNQAGVDPMSGAPSEVTQEQLAELGIRLTEPQG